MGPADLNHILEDLPTPTDDRVLSGISEDASVCMLTPTLALVQTVDFITPVLSDPYAFGTVAVANALSDIYAMGAQPAYGLNIVEYPLKTLPASILKDILRGGSDKAKEAGITINGGHTIEDNAPKYGMTVTGFIHPDNIVRKQGSQPGDVLFLTKPIGTGVISSAIDRGLIGIEHEEEIYRIMTHLNRGASEAMLSIGVNGCTDVTGFGLLGHLYEMMEGNQTSAVVDLHKVPLIEDVCELIKLGAISTGTHNNYSYLRNRISIEPGITQEDLLLLCDAQTSGGLLIAVPEEKADLLQSALLENECIVAEPIGRITEKKEKAIILNP